jgi:hypothetical protein
MIKIIITNMSGELLKEMIITAEQSHLLRTDWTGDEVKLAKCVVEDISKKYNVVRGAL